MTNKVTRNNGGKPQFLLPSEHAEPRVTGDYKYCEKWATFKNSKRGFCNADPGVCRDDPSSRRNLGPCLSQTDAA
jgi:hypothetical protein